MTNAKFDALFGGPPRKPEIWLTQREMDLAASIQAVTEEVVLRLARSLAAETGMKQLCLAGGVALNCVANGKVLRDGAFDDIWIQPAAGDAGGAIGAALAACHQHEKLPRAPTNGPDGMSGSYLGPLFKQPEIEQRLTAAGAHFSVCEDGAVVDTAATALADGQAVGWFQGRMEFGPRALGARSILGDPRSPSMQKTLNLKVKYRESFRPFAPGGAARGRGRLVRARRRFALHAAGRAGEGGPPTRNERAEENALFGIDKLNVPRSDIPAVTPCRLFRAHPDRARRHQSRASTR